jgi:hypothetical protein
MHFLYADWTARRTVRVSVSDASACNRKLISPSSQYIVRQVVRDGFTLTSLDPLSLNVCCSLSLLVEIYVKSKHALFAELYGVRSPVSPVLPSCPHTHLAGSPVRARALRV